LILDRNSFKGKLYKLYYRTLTFRNFTDEEKKQINRYEWLKEHSVNRETLDLVIDIVDRFYDLVDLSTEIKTEATKSINEELKSFYSQFLHPLISANRISFKSFKEKFNNIDNKLDQIDKVVKSEVPTPSDILVDLDDVESTLQYIKNLDDDLYLLNQIYPNARSFSEDVFIALRDQLSRYFSFYNYRSETITKIQELVKDVDDDDLRKKIIATYLRDSLIKPTISLLTNTLNQIIAHLSKTLFEKSNNWLDQVSKLYDRANKLLEKREREEYEQKYAPLVKIVGELRSLLPDLKNNVVVFKEKTKQFNQEVQHITDQIYSKLHVEFAKELEEVVDSLSKVLYVKHIDITKAKETFSEEVAALINSILNRTKKYSTVLTNRLQVYELGLIIGRIRKTVVELINKIIPKFEVLADTLEKRLRPIKASLNKYALYFSSNSVYDKIQQSLWEVDLDKAVLFRKPVDTKVAVQQKGAWKFREGDKVLVHSGMYIVPVSITKRLPGMKYEVTSNLGNKFIIEEKDIFLNPGLF